MEFTDYYAVLGVAPDASEAEIKKAYRKRARQTHPDLKGGAASEADFKAINEAYDVLKDPERRAEYDAMRRGGGPRAEHFGASPAWEERYSFDQGGSGRRGAGEGFGDVFETFYGRGAGAGGPFGQAGFGGPGGDLHARIEIALEDSFRGATRQISVPVSTMGPEGRVRVEHRTLSVTIPKGITGGQFIRLPGDPGPVRGTPGTGDIFLEVAFAPHPVYRVDGRDLYMDLPVAPWEAALGGHVVLPTPGGKVDLTIPANTRSGQKLRLRGKGLPGHPAGDLYASLHIVNPKVTTEEARTLFEKMAREMPFDPRAELGG